MTLDNLESRPLSPEAISSREQLLGPIRLALIGCGAISEQMHLPVLAGHKDVQLIVLVDRDTSRAEKLSKGYGVGQVLADASGLSADKIDAAIIATPPFHHAPCAIGLMRKGIHVMVEKPMAINLAEAEEMVAVADDANVILSVGFFRRLNPSIRLLKSLINSGWAGRPLRFQIEGGGMYNWPAATLGNMQRKLAGGGVLIDFGTHMLDLMFALFEEPAVVRRYSDNSLGGIESDCMIDVTVQHQGQPIDGRVELARTRNIGNFIRVECEKATLECLVGDRFRVHVTTFDKSIVDPVSGQLRDFAIEASWQGDPKDESWYATFGRQFDDWIAAIRSGDEPQLSGRSALATSRLIDSCYRQPTLIQEPWVWNQIALSGSPMDESAAEAEATGCTVPAVHIGGHESKVLVTGATGFIGSRVVELLRLREKRDVRVLVHNPGNASRLTRLDVEMVKGDLSSPEDAQRLVNGCDEIIHCAIGTAWGEPRKVVHVNVVGTRSLASAACGAGAKRFVHVSTMAVYGDDSWLTGSLDENTPANPVKGNIYSESKAEAEKAVLKLTTQGLAAVVFRPARVFGPFSNIFITRPLQAISAGRFGWLGSPDVPCDMVYVDNVAESLIAALSATREQVVGQVFNIGDADRSTWREFYQFFAEELQLSLASVPVDQPAAANGSSRLKSFAGFPGGIIRGVGQIVASTEFKSLGRRVLNTDHIGYLPRTVIDRVPAFEQGIRKIIRADDVPPIYRPAPLVSDDRVQMGSGGSVLDIKKLRDRIGFVPPVPRDESLQLTLDWIRYARIV